MGENSVRPVKSFRIGSIQVAIWENERTNTRTGEVYTARSITAQRSYKDAEGNYKNTTTFDAAHLPKLILLLQRAYEFCVIGPEEDGEESILG